MSTHMKIISVDNYNREQPGVSDDRLVADRVDSYYVDSLVASLNAIYFAVDKSRHFKAVPDDYQLRTFEP